MTSHRVIRALACTLEASLAAVVGLSLGCAGASPASPSPPPSAAPPPVPALVIAALAPSTGSTGGGTAVSLTGSGFQADVTVTLDGEPRTVSFGSSTVIQFTTQAHAAGAVDLAVTNPGGQEVRLAGGYAYAPPQSFDFNGNWAGYALAHPDAERARGYHADMEIRFTIQGNALISVTCGTSTAVALSPTPRVNDGEFSFAGEDVALSGRIVSAVSAVGTISTEHCPATRWAATRQ